MQVFPDTNVLLSYSAKLFETYDDIIICGYVLQEIDKLKMSHDDNKKYMARQATRDIESNLDKIEFIVNEGSYSLPLYLDSSLMDNKIISLAKDLTVGNDILVLSNDILFRHKCHMLGIRCEKFEPIDDSYTGWKIIEFDEQELANFYESKTKRNKWDLNINEYLLIKDKQQNKIVDVWVWTNKGLKHVSSQDINSKQFGKFVPKDYYQICAMDSLFRNKFTTIKGVAGSGKSMICLSYAISMIEKKSDYDRLVIFINNLPVKNAAKQGFYPGSLLEKLLDGQIGNMLSSKFGARDAVEQLIDQNKIILLPFSDIRGFDTTGMKAIVYITEAQNLDIELVKLAIQRVGEDGQLLLDGDYTAQVDLPAFEGNNNGMRRVSEVYRGLDYYGEVEFPVTHRSKMAAHANNL